VCACVCMCRYESGACKSGACESGACESGACVHACMCRYESGAMDPPDMAAYKRQLVRVRVRRGQALAQLGQLAQALQDYEHAMRCVHARMQGACV